MQHGKQFLIKIMICRLITGVMMILTMKLGFALLEVGSVRNKNTSNILLKNVVDSVTGALIYYIIGFGLQFD